MAPLVGTFQWLYMALGILASQMRMNLPCLPSGPSAALLPSSLLTALNSCSSNTPAPSCPDASAPAALSVRNVRYPTSCLAHCFANPVSFPKESLASQDMLYPPMITLSQRTRYFYSTALIRVRGPLSVFTQLGFEPSLTPVYAH